MALISELTTGDRIRLGAVSGVVAFIVHYSGAFDVRIAIRDRDGVLQWRGANYGDHCKRLKAPVSNATPEPTPTHAQYWDR